MVGRNFEQVQKPPGRLSTVVGRGALHGAETSPLSLRELSVVLKSVAMSDGALRGAEIHLHL